MVLLKDKIILILPYNFHPQLWVWWVLQHVPVLEGPGVGAVERVERIQLLVFPLC